MREDEETRLHHHCGQGAGERVKGSQGRGGGRKGEKRVKERVKRRKMKGVQREEGEKSRSPKSQNHFQRHTPNDLTSLH